MRFIARLHSRALFKIRLHFLLKRIERNYKSYMDDNPYDGPGTLSDMQEHFRKWTEDVDRLILQEYARTADRYGWDPQVDVVLTSIMSRR